MLKAYSWSSTGQTLWDIIVKVGAAAVVLLLNALASAISGGTLQLPYPIVTIPLVSLLLSQLDSFFVQYNQPV